MSIFSPLKFVSPQRFLGKLGGSVGGRLRDDAGRKRECKKSAQFAAADSLRAKHIREEPNLSAHFHANKTVFALQCRENFTTPFWIARHTAASPSFSPV